jgi:hypothetical protein
MFSCARISHSHAFGRGPSSAYWTWCFLERRPESLPENRDFRWCVRIDDRGYWFIRNARDLFNQKRAPAGILRIQHDNAVVFRDENRSISAPLEDVEIVPDLFHVDHFRPLLRRKWRRLESLDGYRSDCNHEPVSESESSSHHKAPFINAGVARRT